MTPEKGNVNVWYFPSRAGASSAGANEPLIRISQPAVVHALYDYLLAKGLVHKSLCILRITVFQEVPLNSETSLAGGS